MRVVLQSMQRLATRSAQGMQDVHPVYISSWAVPFYRVLVSTQQEVRFAVNAVHVKSQLSLSFSLI